MDSKFILKVQNHLLIHSIKQTEAKILSLINWSEYLQLDAWTKLYISVLEILKNFLFIIMVLQCRFTLTLPHLLDDTQMYSSIDTYLLLLKFVRYLIFSLTRKELENNVRPWTERTEWQHLLLQHHLISLLLNTLVKKEEKTLRPSFLK